MHREPQRGNNRVQNDSGDSTVLAYFLEFEEFKCNGTLFNFHSDELCGRVDGTLSALTTELQRGPSE